MRVSVVIPVYNAEPYVRQAVESALAQPETAEVILVEDGSTDHTLSVCGQLAAQCPAVRLCRHHDGGNHGVSATTNLGILKSTCEHIAILGADDFYLPDRFAVAKEMFAADSSLEGVYEAIGTHFENRAARRRWRSLGFADLATMTERVAPGELFAALANGGRGSFSILGLVVKRPVFDRTGLFDQELRLHQDTAMLVKMAAVAKLTPGRLRTPVAVRRVHDNNRWSALRPASDVYRSNKELWKTLWCWSKKNLDEERQRLLLNRFLDRGMFMPRFDRAWPEWARAFRKRLQLALLLVEHPSLVRRQAFWRRCMPDAAHWARRLARATTGQAA